ncbi:hypothetical protein MHYP_G00353290 [Metynnis hypsauchen]
MYIPSGSRPKEVAKAESAADDHEMWPEGALSLRLLPWDAGIGSTVNLHHQLQGAEPKHRAITAAKKSCCSRAQTCSWVRQTGQQRLQLPPHRLVLPRLMQLRT